MLLNCDRPRKIITVTPNPSVDRTLVLNLLNPGQVQRAESTRKDAGGKGINVSRALAANEIGNEAIFPFGGADGEQLLALLPDSPFLNAVAVAVSGETRSNITLVDRDGVTTKINALGDPMSSTEVGDFLAAIESRIMEIQKTTDEIGPKPSVIVVGAGSLSQGMPNDFYVQLGQLCAQAGAYLALDTSGRPLELAVAAGVAGLLKPNDEELEALTGEPVE
ncbi:MAG: PfkB family carbohydrate kinase, partial [Promicromonosporaceae bacterium]|nr:PfkB family carbohydrate kinase [Promicromonosporaceae bacterium]